MRRLDKEIKDQNILDEILYHSQVLRIAFSIENIPHIVPLSYGFSDNKLYIHSATKGSKIDMIKKNDYVCFEMELDSEIIRDNLACNWTTKYRSIIGWGSISIVTDLEQKKTGLDIIMKKYGRNEENFYDENHLNRMVLLVLEIEKLTGKQSGEW